MKETSIAKCSQEKGLEVDDKKPNSSTINHCVTSSISYECIQWIEPINQTQIQCVGAHKCRQQNLKNYIPLQSISILKVLSNYLYIRLLVGSTNQAYSSGLYFRIALKSTQKPSFLKNCSLSLLQGLKSTNMKWVITTLLFKMKLKFLVQTLHT